MSCELRTSVLGVWSMAGLPSLFKWVRETEHQVPRGGVAHARATNPNAKEENSPMKNNSVRQQANGMIANSPSSAFLRQMGYQQVGGRDGLGVWNHFQENDVTLALMQFEWTEMGTRRADHVPVNAKGLWSHNALGPLRKEIWVGELLQAIIDMKSWFFSPSPQFTLYWTEFTSSMQESQWVPVSDVGDAKI